MAVQYTNHVVQTEARDNDTALPNLSEKSINFFNHTY